MRAKLRPNGELWPNTSHQRAGKPDASKFFRKANQEKKTHRESVCADVLHDGGNYQVFIKRDTKESFVSHGAKNIFGFEREWIILDIEPDLRRVSICSISPDVPLLLANRIASAFFNKDHGITVLSTEKRRAP